MTVRETARVASEPMLVCRHCEQPLGWAIEYCPFCGKAQPVAAVKEPAPIPAPELSLMPAGPAPVAAIELRREEEPADPIDPPDLQLIADPRFAPSDDIDPHPDREAPGGRGFGRRGAVERLRRPAKTSTSSLNLDRRWWWAMCGASLIIVVLVLAVRYPLWSPDPTLHPPMVHIPAGSFSMGCKPAEKAYCLETPAHQVQVPDFEMGKYEMTFDEWSACVADGGCTHRPGAEDQGRGRRPVTNISWDDAQQYVAWLRRRTGKPYRLPSEAEWEYAARAGTQTAYSFGNDEKALGDYTWFRGNAGGRTHPVGEKRPNRWGLYDMHGNAWEWVQDNWHFSYQGAPTDGRPWEDISGELRVLRGGSAINDARDACSGCRSLSDPGARNWHIGFRLVLGPQSASDKASR